MYKVEIPSDKLSDNLQAAAIQRRRKLDEERKKIIFNPRVRILGVDLKTLDEQIAYKQSLKEQEKQRDLDFDKSMKTTNQILELMDDQVTQDRKTDRIELEVFRKNFQQTQLRRDFDLYDPNALKNDLPARVDDSDGRCGISGMQRFEGEDSAFKKRISLQKEQMKTWTLEQIHQKEARALEERNEKKRYEEFQKNICDKMEALQVAVQNARREQSEYDRDYNLFLAEERRKRELEAKKNDSEAAYREILNNVNGVFLTETPDVYNIGGGHKVRVDLFKGITQSQKQEILKIQAFQREEAESLREKERKREQEWALQEAANIRKLTLLDRERERRKKEIAIQIRQENQEKAVGDRKRQDYINKVLYTNQPTQAYFSQFNTTSR